MKNTKRCPKCRSQNIVRVPDNQNRHASGNNIYTSAFTLMMGFLEHVLTVPQYHE